jgi:hypothetical protein
MQFTPNNKLASLGTVGLLFLAGIAGMVFLLPASPAHAASATVALSTISSGVQTAATSGTVGSSLTITGDGFASASPIAITTTVGSTTVSWFTSASQNTCAGTFASSIGGVGTGNSLYTGTGATACLTTTATGMFQTTVKVPALPGGAETIVVTDGTNSVSTSYTITSKVSFAVASGSLNFGFPEQTLFGTSTFTITGFGASELVTVATTAFTLASFATTTCTTSTVGSCTFTDASLVVADQTGGAKSMTATGGTSGLTASTTYTVKPWVVFYDSSADLTTFSFIGAAPTSLLVEGHGFASTAIASGSITIGGITTNHAAITPGSTGAFYGQVVSPTANVPYGPVSVVIGGNTFNYASGNILLKTNAGANVNYWGGALVSSIAGSVTSTGVATTDASSYKPGTPAAAASTTSPAPVQNQIGYFGYGFVSNAGGGGVISVTTPTGLTYSSAPAFNAGNGGVGGASGAAKPDANGAFFATAGLGDTPWSSVSTPTIAAAYNPVFSQAVTAPANVLSPSFGITPWIDTSSASTCPGSGTCFSSTVDFTTSNVVFNVHGFGATDVVTLTIGGAALTPAASITVAATGAGASTAAKVPDLAGGPQNVVATGSISAASVTATGAITYDPAIVGSVSACSTSCALSVQAGPAGSTAILRTGTNYGVHGLSANTPYYIVWNGQTGLFYTFTSTATGGIPVPGVQITIPADTSGLHVIDIQKQSSFGTSAIYAGTLQGDYYDADTGLTGTQNTQFGDMLFLEGTSLVAAPTVVNVGGSTTITGNGLAANTQYDLGVSQAGVDSSSPAVPSTCALTGTGPASAPSSIAGQFTSTSTGTVPSGISLSINDMSTYSGLEQGTLYCVFAQTGPAFGTTAATGVAEFELQASAVDNMTSAPSGHNVILSAHALNANKGYNILFAPYACGNSGSICGTVVGAILTNAQGAGSSTYTVPSTIQTSAGSQPITSGAGYNVELQAVGSSAVALASPPTLTVGSVSTTSCNTTTCISSTGTAKQSAQGPYQGITSTFTNNSNAPVTAFVYAVVHNALGQTVDISTATITAPAGGSATAFNVLFGLPSGTYSVSLFVTSSSGTAISTSSTVSVTI